MIKTNVNDWSVVDHIGHGVNVEDGAIWLCVGIQLIFAGYAIPDWCSEYVTPGREYVATCLLDGSCPAAQDLLISSIKYDTMHHHRTALSLTTMDARSNTIPHAMLNTNYGYTTANAGTHMPQQSGQVDIRQQTLSADESQSIILWLQKHSTTHILHEDLFRGEVTTGDIQALVRSSTLTIGLLLHLLFSQFPVGHPTVFILDQSLMEVIRDQQWVAVMHDRSHPAHNSLLDFFQHLGIREWIVVLYCDNTHFTSHVIRCNYQTNDEVHVLNGQISYLDSFLDSGSTYSNILTNFLTWACTHSRLQINRSLWTIVQKLMSQMIRQAMYYTPGQKVR